MKCSSCGKPMPESGICPSCGVAPVDAFAPTRSQGFTGAAGPAKAPVQPEPLEAIHTSNSIEDARFAPGSLLGGRYRIVALLGRGGMGQVYRADDLILKQTVALKFLPERIAADSAALERFRREVRIAREISHPNVCRVYDIGESGGLHFLSMEFIKGEELASVLKRFGRLPADKAGEIARQICAGVAAAHKRGVLHRDLKPGNVMIDERGDAHVTDFGLAALAEEIHAHEIAGTFAYMSPEQLTGRELTVRSDIYSLGLVLYELYTGKRAFDRGKVPEPLQRRVDSAPVSPSSHVKDLDPLVEQIILRCLEVDPEKRPDSALRVAAALPGGDALAAALAMGETPSPEMVAAAPKEGILRPVVAGACFAAAVVMLAVALLLSYRTNMANLMPMEKSPEVLAERAREIAQSIGYTQRPLDTAEGFDWYDPLLLKYVKEHDSSVHRWDPLRSGEAPALQFWYRQRTRYLSPITMYTVQEYDPPLIVPGEILVNLDSQGRLGFFTATPPADAASGPAPPTDWAPLFAAARLDFQKFKPGTVRWTPLTQSDTQVAWEGVLPGRLQIPILVQAAAFQGKPVYFNVIFPWDTANLDLLDQYRELSLKEKAATYLSTTVLLIIAISAVLLAWRNVRSGRSDRQGAFRLAIYNFLAMLASRLLLAHHVPVTRIELDILETQVAWALLWAVFVWIIYLALEPFVRASWPYRLISWKRFLSGHFRDPLVGRDALVGITIGMGAWVSHALRLLLPGWLGLPPYQPWQTMVPLGLRRQWSFILEVGGLAPVAPLFILLFFLLLYVILRREWLAALGTWAVLTLYYSLQFDNLVIDLFFVGAAAAVLLFGLMRFGLLTATFAGLVFTLCVNSSMTPNFSAWYSGATIMNLVIVVGFAAYSGYISLGGQALFRAGLLDQTESRA